MIAFSEFRIATFHFVDLVCRGAKKVISAEDVCGTSATGLVLRAPPVHTAICNCTRDEGGPFESGNPVLISNHRKQWAAEVASEVAEKAEQKPRKKSNSVG